MAPMLNMSTMLSICHKMHSQNAQLNFAVKFAKNPNMRLCGIPQDRPKGVAELLLRENMKFDFRFLTREAASAVQSPFAFATQRPRADPLWQHRLNQPTGTTI